MAPIPLYLKTDEQMPRPADAEFYWLTRDGAFLCRNHPFFVSDVPTRRPIKALAAHGPGRRALPRRRTRGRRPHRERAARVPPGAGHRRAPLPPGAGAAVRGLPPTAELRPAPVAGEGEDQARGLRAAVVG